MQEIWKDIKEYEGLYQVSNLGNVKSLDRLVDHKNKGYKQKIKGKLKSVRLDSSNQYYLVDLCKNGKSKTLLVHRLVANAFIINKKTREK